MTTGGLASANEYQWVSGNDGNFNDALNWREVGNPAVDHVPDTTDEALFTSGTVTFSASAATGQAFISGDTTFHLNNDYTVAPSTASGGVKLTDDYGNLTIDGSGTFNTGHLQVGYNGYSGTMSVTGATIHSSEDTSVLAAGTGSSGTVTIGSGATWNNDKNLAVGFDGGATLTIKDGGKVYSELNGSFSSGIGGGFDGSGGFHYGSGTVTVTGSGSLWKDTTAIGVGLLGSAGSTLNILNGGKVQTAQGQVSNGLTPSGVALAGAQGTVKIDGNGSNWDLSDSLYLGVTGNSDLTVQNQGKLTVGGTFDIGVYHAVGGTTGGDGTLTVQDGGIASMTSTGTVRLGIDNYTSGNITIDGSGSSFALDQSNVNVGEHGTASITVSGGGQFTGGGDLNIAAISGAPQSTVDVTDADSKLTAKNLYVGQYGDAKMTIENQGTVALTDAGSVAIGSQANSTGELDITGSGSSLDVNHGTLDVGDNGTGTLKILDGGKLTNADTIRIGHGNTGIGHLYVEGDGSTLNTTGKVIISDGSQSDTYLGDAAVDTNGKVTSGDLTIGNQATALGTLTLESGGSWTVNGNLTVGENGRGYLYVDDGGLVTVNGGDLLIGDKQGSLGFVFLQDGGEIHDNIILGVAGNGYYAVNGGSQYDPAGTFVIGSNATGSGILDVYNTGSQIKLEDDFTVSEYGTGTMNVYDNASMFSDKTTLAEHQGSQATVDIYDTGSLWHNYDELIVGDAGKATVTVEKGGRLTLDGDLSLGEQSTGDGTLTLDGSDSEFDYTGGDITVGGEGTGKIIIQNAASADVTTPAMSLGEKSTGSGSVTVTGASTLNTGKLTVGGSGQGTLLVDTSSTLNSDGDVTFAENADSTGTGTITDDSSSWTIAGSLTVGGSGDGQLNVENTAALTVNGADVTLGEHDGSSGTLTISLADTTFSYGGELKAGAGGDGTFAVQAGASVGLSALKLGEESTGSGKVNVTGLGSALSVTNDFTAGDIGYGEANITDGASFLTIGDAKLADQAGSSATATVDSQSTWTAEGDLVVASQGTANLNVQGGAQLHALKAITLAEIDGSSGMMNIDGSNTLVTVQTLNVGGSEVDPEVNGGTAHVTLTNQSQLQVAESLTTWDNGTVDTTDGAITIGASAPGANQGTLQVNEDGKLEGTGTIVGQVINAGGQVGPGHSPGKLNITGDYTQQADGTLVIQIAGTSSDLYDILAVDGHVTLGGTLEIDFLNGFVPAATDPFNFLTFTNGLDGQFDKVDLKGLADGSSYQFDTSNPGTLGLVVTAATPEPASWCLLVAGMSLLVLRRRHVT